MHSNRRNFYRILQVQPEAPIEVIKASWRALMCSANMHPDRGGEHQTAALINAAFDVLSNPEKKRLYDASLKLRPARSDSGPTSRATAPKSAGSSVPTHQCPLCQLGYTGPLQKNSRCQRCDAPLIRAVSDTKTGRELLGRRTGARWPRQEAAEIRCGWPSTRLDTRLIDMSMGGVRFSTPKALGIGERVRVSTRRFDSVVEIIESRSHGAIWQTRGRFLTLMPIQQVGVYVMHQA